MIAILTFFTAGIFLIAYWLWREYAEEKTPGASVAAIAEGQHSTRLTVMADKPQYAEALNAWIARELVEKRRAAPEEAPTVEGDQASSDASVPELIRELAALRDSGAITDEEYESKKQELLDRM